MHKHYFSTNAHHANVLPTLHRFVTLLDFGKEDEDEGLDKNDLSSATGERGVLSGLSWHGPDGFLRRSDVSDRSILFGTTGLTVLLSGVSLDLIS